MTTDNPTPALPPWTPEMPLRADATDEQIAERIIHLKPKGSEGTIQRLERQVKVAREFAAACVAEVEGEWEPINHRDGSKAGYRRVPPPSAAWQDDPRVTAAFDRVWAFLADQNKEYSIHNLRLALNALCEAVASASAPRDAGEPNEWTVKLDFDEPSEAVPRVRWLVAECEVLARDVENRSRNMGDELSLEIGAKEAARFRANALAMQTVLDRLRAAPPERGEAPDGWRELALRSANALAKVAHGCGPLGSFQGVMSTEMSDLAAKLSKAAQVPEAKVALWWLTDPDGNGMMDEACVFTTKEEGDQYVSDANLTGFSLTPLFRSLPHPAGERAAVAKVIAEHLDLNNHPDVMASDEEPAPCPGCLEVADALLKKFTIAPKETPAR